MDCVIRGVFTSSYVWTSQVELENIESSLGRRDCMGLDVDWLKQVRLVGAGLERLV